MDDLSEYLVFAKYLAEEAGKIMVRYFRAIDINTEWKSDNTPLTVADTKINDLVIKRVKKHFPKHGVLGEELSFEPHRPLIWVVDPIDGTIPFSLGIPTSTFSLALVDKKDGQSLVAVALDPFLKHLFSAAKGQGAFLNSKAIQTSRQTTLKRSYVSLGGIFGVESMSGVLEVLDKKNVKTLSLLSQVYTTTRVASGELIGSIHAHGFPWDTAATSLITAEAGGVVTDMSGRPRRYDEIGDGCIQSANRQIHEKLINLVSDARNRH